MERDFGFFFLEGTISFAERSLADEKNRSNSKSVLSSRQNDAQIIKNTYRTAAREADEARRVEEAKTHDDVDFDTFDCNQEEIVKTVTTMKVARDKGKKGEQDVKKDEVDDDEDGDSDIDYDDFDAIEAIRAKRLRELRAKKARRNRNKALGEYREIVESEFLPTVTKKKFAAVHFYHREFERCKIMDQKLQRVALKHDEVKFVKLNAEKSPFFVTKLQIRTLPTVVLFINGVAKHRIVGFTGLDGGRDNFRTRSLETKLIDAGLIEDASPFGTYPDDEQDESDDE